jgi:23S rRNA pseudouridine1911/1915/1917 synthase
MGIVHRLDKDTSGLVVVAKTSESYDYLKNLFAERKIKKEYLALVYGRAKKHDVIESSLAKIGQRGSSRVRVSQEGKPAKTEYWAEKYYNASRPPLKLRGGEGELSPLDQFTLVRIELHTGRTHQIRVHFSDRGHPVMGDKLYGKPESLKLNQVLNRQFLHASRLEFQAPDRTWIEVESPLPEGLKRVLEFLSTKSEIRNNI